MLTQKKHTYGLKIGKGTTIGNYGTHLSRGVSVLISNRVDISILSKKSDNQGRLAIVKIKICDTPFNLLICTHQIISQKGNNSWLI